LFVKDSDKLKLYVSGANSFGQLGIEDIVNTLKPTLIPVILKALI